MKITYFASTSYDDASKIIYPSHSDFIMTCNYEDIYRTDPNIMIYNWWFLKDGFWTNIYDGEYENINV